MPFLVPVLTEVAVTAAVSTAAGALGSAMTPHPGAPKPGPEDIM